MVTLTNKGLEGLARIVNAVFGGTPAYTAYDHMALGSDSTAENAADTELNTEITTNGGARAASTEAYEASYKSTWVHTWNFSGALAIKECGVFDGATPGAANSNILMRHVFAATKNVINGDSLQLTMKLTFS